MKGIIGDHKLRITRCANSSSVEFVLGNGDKFACVLVDEALIKMGPNRMLAREIGEIFMKYLFYEPPKDSPWS